MTRNAALGAAAFSRLGGQLSAGASGYVVANSPLVAAESFHGASLPLAVELTRLGQAMGDDAVLARGLCRLALIQAWAEPETGSRTAHDAVRLARETAQLPIAAQALQWESSANLLLGRAEAAFALADEAARVCVQCDFRWGEAWANTGLFARRGRGAHRRATSGWESLTPSERRVVVFVDQHLSNDEIAERLFVSVPTVKSHLNRVFAKLGVANRAQLAAAAHRRGASWL